MVTILHGENNTASRQELTKLKAEAETKSELIILDGTKVDLTGLKQALEARSLLASDKIVILENFLGAKKRSKDEELIAYLRNEEPTCDLILWESQEVGSSLLHLFPKAKVRLFKLDPHLFRFLETLRPGNQQKMIESFRQTIIQEDVNLIFHMLIRQFRLLLFLKNGGKKGLEEVDRMADWQKARLAKQSEHFTSEGLLAIYRQLLAMDYQEKSGKTAYPLSQTLELFLANL